MPFPVARGLYLAGTSRVTQLTQPEISDAQRARPLTHLTKSSCDEPGLRREGSSPSNKLPAFLGFRMYYPDSLAGHLLPYKIITDINRCFVRFQQIGLVPNFASWL